MLSYRHAFHAGNHADVLKHFILSQLLIYLNQKDKPYWVIDTHAGAGMYALNDAYASKGCEYVQGVARLWQVTDLPAALQLYLDTVRQMNTGGALAYYPGSPWVAFRFLRPMDRLRLFELHSTDAPLLQANFAAYKKQVLVQASDGFAGLRALLPPPTRRGLVLIDPSYEDKEDYRRVPRVLEDALKRFATGLYVVWYPLLPRPEPERMVANIFRMPGISCLDVQLQVHAPTVDGFGMYGSGMLMINPPWTLEPVLREVLPVLVRLLGRDGSAGFRLRHSL